MILLAAFLAGDAWSYDVALRYDDREGVLLQDRERWTVRVGKGATFEAERVFVGTVVDEGVLVASGARPEATKGEIGRDGTLALKADWSDPAASAALRRVLAPTARDERVAGWPVVRRLTQRDAEARLPGSGLQATLTVETTLASARLGGKDVDPKASHEGTSGTTGADRGIVRS